MFPFADRMELVKKGVGPLLKNVKIHHERPLHHFRRNFPNLFFKKERRCNHRTG